MYIDKRFIFLIIALMLLSSFVTLFSNEGALSINNEPYIFVVTDVSDICTWPQSSIS